MQIRGQFVDTRQSTHAASLVTSLLRAETRNVPGILDEMEQYGKWIDVPLRRAHQQAADDSTDKLRTSLALHATNRCQGDYLFQRLLTAAPAEVPLIVSALSTEREALVPQLWTIVEDSKRDDRQRLRAACALAAYDPTDPRWSDSCDEVAWQLVSADPLTVPQWQTALQPVSQSLIEPLSRFFDDAQLGELQRTLATSLLADYAAQDVEPLTQLVCRSDPQQFGVLFPVLESCGAGAMEPLRAVLRRQATHTWNDRPIPADWSVPDDEVQRRIEAAEGIIHTRFAFCQTLPIERWEAVADSLREAGYRPIRVRPFWNGTAVAIAAVWTRDGQDWQVTLQATSEELAQRDAQLRQQGYLPQDVCGYGNSEAGGERTVAFAAVWKLDVDSTTEVRMVAGVAETQMPTVSTMLLNAGFSQATCSVVYPQVGQELHCAIFQKPNGQTVASSLTFAADVQDFRGDAYPGLQLTDMVEVQRPTPAAEAEKSGGRHQRYGVWNVSTEHIFQLIAGHSPQSHLEKARGLIAGGYRPSALSLTNSAELTPTVAAVWLRPRIRDSEKETLALWQANAAVALFRMGQCDEVWSHLRHTPDPRLRSYLVNLLGRLGANPAPIIERLKTETSVSSRRALILALGGFRTAQIPASRRRTVTALLLELYDTDPDAGIHAAAQWLLRRWGQRQQLERIVETLATPTIDLKQLWPVNRRNWHVNGQGQTLVAIGPKLSFVMGSPVTEKDRAAGPFGAMEHQHWKQIDRRFLIMMHEVTVEQYLRFRPDFSYNANFAASRNCPINQVTWYDTAAYCNWLSEVEDIPPDQWCYLPNEDGLYAAGMKPAPDILQRTGYRLPTETEWEYACRAESETSRYYGETKALLGEFARYSQDASDRRALPVGSLKPNDFGLFDMHGNALEWCQDVFGIYPTPKEIPPTRGPAGLLVNNLSIPDRVDPSVVTDTIGRVLRGADFYAPAEYQRSARRLRYEPIKRVGTVGIRLVRTVPSPEHDAGDR